MRAGPASQHETLLRRFQRDTDYAQELGVRGIRFDDVGDGSTLRVNGRVLANFGNCSYLGLNVDPRLKAGAIEAVERFGPLYSSSIAYSAVDLYDLLTEKLQQVMGAQAVVIPPTTTLGHLAVLPSLVSGSDVILVDRHSHASLQLTTQVLAGRGIPIQPVAHNDVPALVDAIESAEKRYEKIWYVADGLYSMYGDTAPVETIDALMRRHPSLHVYFDDAHGFSWTGRHGRGLVLSRMPWNERLIVAAGLAKSFGTGGAVVGFGDPKLARRVELVGGPMNFSGPIHPPTLGAMVASADIHLSDEHEILRERIDAQIDRVTTLLARHSLPAVSWARTPVWLVRVGELHHMLEVARLMLDDGYFINVSGFPVVPVGMAGIRFTQTLSNTDEQIIGMIQSLQRSLHQVVGETEAVVDLTEYHAS
ncbi:MAG TPA: aminotransferase class I/II-fold pyridoxal phosphate-dependent enzyme [Acidimicrobiia bacterium]|nr:aminotransferase class I/II-fold pyridoxal phosphate-dependent enzyme [Acidimicrobiia bacterium]